MSLRKTILNNLWSLVGIILALAIYLPLVWWRGFAAVKLWQWFIEPQWPTLWHPSIYSAIGVMLVINVFLPHQPVARDVAKYSWATPFVYPAAMLFFGWLWMWFQWGT